MKSIIISIGMLVYAPIAFASGIADVSLSSPSLSSNNNHEINVGLDNMAIQSQADRSAEGKGVFVFDLKIENASAHTKTDLQLPLQVNVQDEYGNQYRNISTQILGLVNPDQISLYPGDSIRVACQFQAPVSSSRILTIQVADKSGMLQYHFPLLTAKIDSWKSLGKSGYQPTSDDLIIVYPHDRKVFAPGDKVFLKVDFSKKVRRPKNINIILPNYMLTDDKASGSYELRLPKNLSDGNMQVVVIAEWDGAPESTIVSKTLVLQIKG